jgi:shikimate O-hydroxycinnamoyltransferase
MEVKVMSSRLVKPSYPPGVPQPDTTQHVPCSVFDKITYHIQMAIIYAFSPPVPSIADIEHGLAAVLGVYRAFAGQVRPGPDGELGVLLNDHGAQLTEAFVDAHLIVVAPARPSPELQQLHPGLHVEIEEVVQVQLTTFTCGSLVVGFTANHAVADGRATSSFLVAWGRTMRGFPIGLPPPPLHHHPGLFPPRDPPRFEFEHRGVEYRARPTPPASSSSPSHLVTAHGETTHRHDIVIHKAHFTGEFITALRAKASEGRGHPFSRFETIVGHVWRAMTRARGLRDPCQASAIRISVDGRPRLGVPQEYFGNLVLWAFPRTTVGNLLTQSLTHAAQVIHDAVKQVDRAYFQSFLDFASSGVVEEEGLETTAVLSSDVLCPDLDVDSWLTFPFQELDLGTGGPSYFMPPYIPIEGMFFLVPSCLGDGSVDAFVPVFKHTLEAFMQCCCSVE